MTLTLIALFACLAVCALIGWAFIHLVGWIARRLSPEPTSHARHAAGPTIVFRQATSDELAARAEIRSVATLPDGVVVTYFEKGRWKNMVQGNTRASNVHDTKAAAIAQGREMAKKRRSEHVVKPEDGTPVRHAGRDPVRVATRSAGGK